MIFQMKISKSNPVSWKDSWDLVAVETLKELYGSLCCYGYTCKQLIIQLYWMPKNPKLYTVLIFCVCKDPMHLLTQEPLSTPCTGKMKRKNINRNKRSSSLICPFVLFNTGRTSLKTNHSVCLGVQYKSMLDGHMKTIS